MSAKLQKNKIFEHMNFNPAYFDCNQSDRKQQERLEQSKKNVAASRFILVGHYGFRFMSRMYDPVIYDCVAKKYFVKIGNNNFKCITMDEIQRNCKNINNYNMHYMMLDKKDYHPYVPDSF